MAQCPPNQATTSSLLSTQAALITALTSFLTVSIHHLLFLRRIYPPVSFLVTRAYNYPVRQNRHPAVCNWVLSAVDALRDQLKKATVEKVALCIFECENNDVLERWTFDLRALPAVAVKELETEFDAGEGEDEDRGVESGEKLESKINVADLEAQFRAMLSRLNSAAGRMKPLPDGGEYSFTLTIEVKADADRPVGRLREEERKWVAAEPDDWDGLEDPDVSANPAGGVGGDKQGKTVPVRRLEAGDLRMEVWVEESKAKFERIQQAEKRSARSSNAAERPS